MLKLFPTKSNTFKQQEKIRSWAINEIGTTIIYVSPNKLDSDPLI